MAIAAFPSQKTPQQTRQKTLEKTAVLFLYDIRENLELHSNDWYHERQNGRILHHKTSNVVWRASTGCCHMFCLREDDKWMRKAFFNNISPLPSPHALFQTRPD